MRRKDKEITEKAEIEAILHKALILRLAMCDNGLPYVVPVNFCYQDGVLYVHSARKGRKFEILSKSPTVCFEAACDEALSVPPDPSKACGYGMHFRSVIGYGQVEIKTDRASVIQGLTALMSRISEKPFTFPEDKVDKTALLKITITSMTGKKDVIQGPSKPAAQQER